MNYSQKTDRFRWLIYITMGFVTILLIFPVFYSYITTIKTYEVKEIWVKDGNTDLTEYDFDDVRPFELNGEWIVYDDVYFDTEQIDSELLVEPSIQKLPTLNLLQAKGTCTYQLSIKLNLDNSEKENAVIGIPFATESIRVYVNGFYVEGYHPLHPWSGFDTEAKLYSIGTYYDSNLDVQNIMISINNNPDNTDLFNRKILISTEANIVAMEKITLLLQGMLVAMMFFCALSGIIYNYLSPSYTVLTFMHLFDTALMFHLFFNMSSLPQIVMDTATLGSLGDSLFRRLDLFFLFLAGFLGNALATLLFDTDKYYSKRVMKQMQILYVVLMIVFVCSPEELDRYGMFGALAVMLASFVVILLEVIRSYKLRAMNVYKWLNFVKTVWFGLIVFMDVVTLNSSQRPKTILIIMYASFFLVHMIIRAIEYRAPYIKLVEVNSNLECLVEERTIELQKANEILRKINTVDPLTDAFNRMYFEEEIQKLIEGFGSTEEITSLHLCMFDLDNFKTINDTYGHLAGDEQLIDVVKHAKVCVKDDAIISRIGGEEFTLLFVNHTDENVIQKIELLRLCLERESKKEGKTTGSFGVSKAEIGISRKRLFVQVDKCLYYAKEHGKNQIAYNFNGEIENDVSHFM